MNGFRFIRVAWRFHVPREPVRTRVLSPSAKHTIVDVFCVRPLGAVVVVRPEVPTPNMTFASTYLSLE